MTDKQQEMFEEMFEEVFKDIPKIPNFKKPKPIIRIPMNCNPYCYCNHCLRIKAEYNDGGCTPCY